MFGLAGAYQQLPAAMVGTPPYGVIFGAISSGAHLLLEPLARQTQYGVNVKNPNLLPDPSALIDLFNKSGMPKSLLNEYLLAHGIPSPGMDVGQPHLWSDIIDRSTNTPALDALLALLYREQYAPAMLRWLIALHGFKDRDAAKIMTEGQPWGWTPEQIRILRAVYNLRTDLAGAGLDVAEPAKNYQNWLKSTGMHLDTDREKFETLIQPPSTSDSVEARNRGIITQEQFREWLTIGGLTDDNAFATVDALRSRIPNADGALLFDVRGVFDKHMSHRLGLDHEYEESATFQVWAQRNGITGTPFISGDALRQGMQQGDISENQAARISAHQDEGLRSWTQAYWRSHWILPNPEQALEMLRRLRPADPTKPTVGGKLQARMPVVPGSQSEAHPEGVPIHPIEMHDVNLIQKAHANLPKFRAALAGLSYALPRIFDIRRIAEYSLRDGSFQDRAIGLPCIDNDGRTLPERIANPTDADRRRYLRSWLKEQYLDRGQSPENAATSAVLAFAQAERTVGADDRAVEKEWERRFVRVAERAYLTGRIGSDQYAALSFPDNFLGDRKRWELRILDEENSQRRFDANVRAVRTEYEHGTISAESAAEILARNGMSPQAVSSTMQAWPLRMTTARVMARTSTILRWYNELLISKEAAVTRLELIGWTRADALLEVQLPAPRGSRRAQQGVNRLPPSQPALKPSNGVPIG